MATYDIACCYFPTTVMFVDDQTQHLHNIKTNLNENIVSKLYTNPTEAITFLKERYQPISYIKQWSQSLNRREGIDLGSTLEEQEQTHSYIDIDIAAIHRQTYDPKRFDEISLVVVDYSMPGMNGLELCKQLKELPIKKLMLTGQASHELGIEALNNGIIDKFILKGSENFNNKFNSIISELQQQYFYDLSDAVIQHLAASPYCPLDDRIFREKFAELRKEHNIIEYYLVKDTGCFLLLDINGNISWLAIKTEQEMQHDYEITHDSEAPAELIAALQHKKKLLFHITTGDLVDYFQANWRDYLYPAIELQGEHGKIYYSLIEGAHKYDIIANEISSYKDYLLAL